ncbi:VanZ family protein [Litorimonas sp. WD9-15]|uniref:VanZ family protein n=1 Tax=Litorimonas sp. WD9-15 TaxID=3418716 RepID=UPI003D0284FC
MTRLIQILSILATLVVIYMSLRPSFSTGGTPHVDKVLHLFSYGVLAGLTRLGWPRLWGGWVVVGFISLGIVLEFAQHFMGLGRTGSVADAIANALGVLLAVILFHLIRKRLLS